MHARVWLRLSASLLYSISACTFQVLAASLSPPGPISSKFQSRALSDKRKSHYLQTFSVATKGPYRLSLSQPIAIPGAAEESTWRPCGAGGTPGEGWCPNDRAGVGEGSLLPAPAPAPALGMVTHRREAAGRGEQPPTGAGRRGRQVEQVRSAPPRAQSAQSLGEFTSCPASQEHPAAVFSTLSHPTPRACPPSSRLQQADSSSALSSACAQHGAPPGPLVRAPAPGDGGGGRGSER